MERRPAQEEAQPSVAPGVNPLRLLMNALLHHRRVGAFGCARNPLLHLMILAQALIWRGIRAIACIFVHLSPRIIAHHCASLHFAVWREVSVTFRACAGERLGAA
jgi:hypothetical protein